MVLSNLRGKLICLILNFLVWYVLKGESRTRKDFLKKVVLIKVLRNYNISYLNKRNILNENMCNIILLKVGTCEFLNAFENNS